MVSSPSPTLLRAALFSAELDAEIISNHMTQVEHAGDVVNKAMQSGLGQRVLERVMATVAERPADIAANLLRHPDRAAVLFAYLPAPIMLVIFDRVESVDDTIVYKAVEQAVGSVGVVARERFSFLGAMQKLSEVLACCRPSANNSQPRL